MTSNRSAAAFCAIALAACASSAVVEPADERGDSSTADASTEADAHVSFDEADGRPPDVASNALVPDVDPGGTSMGHDGAPPDARGLAGDASQSDARADSDARASSDAGDPFSLSARCTSGKTWNGTGDQNMRPGETCSVCHSNYGIAGTVYSTGHEPNDCNGVDGLASGVTVLVTDATGLELTLYPNSAGNFFTSITLTPPYHAKVVLNGRERDMASAASSGACNACHTQTGASGAPGRIALP